MTLQEDSFSSVSKCRVHVQYIVKVRQVGTGIGEWQVRCTQVNFSGKQPCILAALVAGVLALCVWFLAAGYAAAAAAAMLVLCPICLPVLDVR